MHNQYPKLSLIEHFQLIPDPRVDRTKDHDLIDILLIAICTLLCGGETFNDMEDFGHAKHDWFKAFLTLRNGIPSHDTFNRVFAALDPQEFLDCFLRWTQSLRQAVSQEIVALDGKALRRALDADQSVKYIVSAWAESNHLVLGQLKVADKSNEITALPTLLRALELAGCVVTVDAMGCQKKIAREIIEADADGACPESDEGCWRSKVITRSSMRRSKCSWRHWSPSEPRHRARASNSPQRRPNSPRGRQRTRITGAMKCVGTIRARS